MATIRKTARIRALLALAAILAIPGLWACEDCEGIKDEAEALRAEYEACEAGDGCTTVNLYDVAGINNCLAAFQCSAAFNETMDLEAFGDKAKRLAEDFESCDECTMAGCLDPNRLSARCNADAGRCELVEIQYPAAMP